MLWIDCMVIDVQYTVYWFLFIDPIEELSSTLILVSYFGHVTVDAKWVSVTKKWSLCIQRL